MGSYRGGRQIANMAGGKGGGMNANSPLRQQQMGLVPSYTPMQTMGGKGGGKGAPQPSAGLQTQGDLGMQSPFALAGSYQSPYSSMFANQLMANLMSPPPQQNPGITPRPSPSYGGMPKYETLTGFSEQQNALSPPSTFGQPGDFAYRPTGTEGDRITPRPTKDVIGFGQPGGPGYRPTIDNSASAQTSEMFGTTMTRTPAEQALLTRRQAELDALQAQQSNLAAQQQEYDQMYGGLTEEQQAYFGDQLQRPSQIPQQPRQTPMYLQNLFRQLMMRRRGY